MTYNDGKIYNDFYEYDLEKKDNIAKDFSEGNDILKQTLLSLWENKINTFGCCNGHIDKDAPPYISFEVRHNSVSLTNRIIKFLSDYNMPNVSIDFNNREDGTLIMSINMTENSKDIILKKIYEYSKDNNNDLNITEILTNAMYLSIFADQHNVNFRYAIDMNQCNTIFGFVPFGTIQIFDDNTPYLSDYIDKIKNTGNIPLLPFKCNDDSLKKLLSIIYPNDEQFKNIDKNR